jgi:gas vesicle protein
MRDYDFDGEPYVVIERDEPGIGTFLLGALVGAGAALLFAPRSGEATRRLIGERARQAGDTMRDAVEDVTDQVSARVAEVRDRVAEQVDEAREAVRRQQRQVVDAFDAGRETAIEARVELERRLAEAKAARRDAGA